MATDRSIDHRRHGDQRLPQFGNSQATPTIAESANSPYRLPKLPATATRRRPSVGFKDKEVTARPVYTRYGYSDCGPAFNSSLDCERTTVDCTSHVFPGPTFNRAAVVPVWSPLMPQQQQRQRHLGHDGAPDGETELGRSFTFMRSKTSWPTAARFSAFGSTLPRAPQSVQQSGGLQQQQLDTGGSFNTEEKPVRWVMRPLRRFQVDRKGQQRNQGPFSREFVVHARAPQNWLRMKWGRPAA